MGGIDTGILIRYTGGMQYKDTKYTVSRDGTFTNSVTNQPIKPVKKRTGYMEVRISSDNKRRSLLHHRAVWEAFYGSIPSGLHINHKDQDKTNNSIENLELVTPQQNQERRTLRHGTDVSSAKLDNDKVRDIKERLSSGVMRRILAEEYGVDYSTIMRIDLGRYWKHVSHN